MKLVFTSCMDAERDAKQEAWSHIHKLGPDILMLLGDQIYMDWGIVLRRNWRRVTDKGEMGLQEFADRMYQRYARQWMVDSFRSLIVGLRSRTPEHLLLVWDDHDFAWNNAWGGAPARTGANLLSTGFRNGDDGLESDKHHVPAPVKRISHALFRQFERVLRHANIDAPYPQCPHLSVLLTSAGEEISWRGRLGGTGPECFLLDTRWHRQGRWPGGPEVSLLSHGTRTKLLEAASQSKGLLVVATGTPMWHKGIFSHDAWCSEKTAGHANGTLPAYQEYAALLSAARRPILFLAGDVHRNRFTGLLPLPELAGGKSHVLQVLSSGAGIGKAGPKTFWPSFAELELPSFPSASKAIGVRFWRLGKEGHASSQDAPELPFSEEGWLQNAPGMQPEQDIEPDVNPLDMLVARPLKRSEWNASNTATVLFEQSDKLFVNTPLAQGEYTIPLRVRAHGWKDAEPEMYVEQLMENGAERLIRDLFSRARTYKRPAIFFIHGFGKSLVDAAGQGYLMRSAFGCEPVVYAWEAGRSEGMFQSLFGVPAAIKSAEKGGFALSAALLRFNLQAADHPDVTSVVVARSTGALALAHALFIDGINKERQLNAVDRIVLSAPLLSEHDWEHLHGFADLIPPVIVTRNRNDETLRLARWVDGESSVLGLDGTFRPNKPTDVCLDFTGAAGVFDLHDYFFTRASAYQERVNRMLLTEKSFDVTQMSDSLIANPHSINVWNVR